jgi:hypothetical protein
MDDFEKIVNNVILFPKKKDYLLYKNIPVVEHCQIVWQSILLGSFHQRSFVEEKIRNYMLRKTIPVFLKKKSIDIDLRGKTMGEISKMFFEDGLWGNPSYILKNHSSISEFFAKFEIIETVKSF